MKRKKFWTLAAMGICSMPGMALAATDAVSTINNLKNLMLNVLSAAGVVAVIWGIVQVAMGFKSQDGSQKTQGVLFLAGGALLAGIGPVLTALGF